MPKRKPNPRIAEIDAAITFVHAHITDYPPESKEFAAMTEQLTKLGAERETLLSNRFSKDQMLATAGTLAGILLVIAYEKTDVWTTKALDVGRKAIR